MNHVKMNQKWYNLDDSLLIGDVVKEVNEHSYMNILTFSSMKYIYNFHITVHLIENNIDFIVYFSMY